MRYIFSTLSFVLTCILGIYLQLLLATLDESVHTAPSRPDSASAVSSHPTDLKEDEVASKEGQSSPYDFVPAFGEIGCAKTAPADATIVLPDHVGPPYHPPNWLVTSPDNKYGHGAVCKDQFIVEVRNTINQSPFWIVGAESDGGWPDNKLLCNATRIEIATYGLVPLYGWTNYYNYVVKGSWQNGHCATVYEPAPPPLAKRYFYKVRSAVKVTTFLGIKQRARGGVVFN